MADRFEKAVGILNLKAFVEGDLNAVEAEAEKLSKKTKDAVAVQGKIKGGKDM